MEPTESPDHTPLAAAPAPREIALRRLAQQHLLEPTDRSPAEVVAELGAVQAQDYAGMKWALGQRCRGVDDAALDAALADGSLIRTHLLRPTWHVVAAPDLRWMLALSGPRVHAGNAGRNRELGIDDAMLRRSRGAMVRALEGGRELTRPELAEALERAGIDTKVPQRLAYLVMAAELDGTLCSGGRRGKQFTYALVDERVPGGPVLERDEALAELARRYFTTRGPATLHDFAWWSGLTTADGRRGADAAGLKRIDAEGKSWWYTGDAEPVSIGSPRAHLLPNYDEYFIGFRDRGAMGVRIANAASSLGRGPSEALLAHLVTIDGQVVGGWQRTLRRTEVVVQVNALVELSTAERRAVEAEAERLGAFLGLAPRVEVTVP